VDENLVFVTGWGNGGMMAYKLVCQLGHKIKAATSFAGGL